VERATLMTFYTPGAPHAFLLALKYTSDKPVRRQP
jgi:hypothetical protein